MTAHGLRRLIERLHPGVSVRELARRADVSVDRIAHYLKPGTPALKRLPTPETMRMTARMLGCPLIDVVQAFNDSLDEPLPWSDNLSDDMLIMLDIMRALPPHRRPMVGGIALLLQRTRAADEPGP